MARLAIGRDTYLAREEIVTETLRQFDAGGEVSIRKLASALRVSPAAIYHHFDNRDQIVQAAVGLVWEEAIAELSAAVGDLNARQPDPVEFLVSGAVAARRAFSRHYQIAPHVSEAPPSDARLAGGLAVFGAVFEQVGLHGEEAGRAFFAYATYCLGSILLNSLRRLEEGATSGVRGSFSSTAVRPTGAPSTTPETGAAIDAAVTAAGSDADEEYFVTGLRALLEGLLSKAGSARR